MIPSSDMDGPVPVADPLIGLCIDGKYQLDSLVGSGGMGTVYQATQINLRRTVALKVLRRDAYQQPGQIELLKREALAVARLRHRNIISIFDFGMSPEIGAYLVLEFLEGMSVRELIAKEGVIDPLVAVELLLPACDAIHAAHEAGVIHRDIKPANLFVSTASGLTEVKVLDFGVAKLSGSELQPLDTGADVGEGHNTLGGRMPGTPLYMAPELFLDRSADARSDIYGLACVLYEMITGWPPFASDSIAALFRRHTLERPRRPSDLVPEVPEWLDVVLLKGLARDPQDRYSSALAFAQALDRSGLRSSDDAPTGEGPALTNLGSETTSFVGRRLEVTDTVSRLETSRLLTLAGPGGIGKTRLSREVARIVLPRFENGVWFVELAPVDDGEHVARAVAQTLGVREEAGRPLVETLAAAIGDSRMLLVLDNAEHVVNACGSLAEELLQSCAGLSVLATSREVLGIDGETVVSIAPFGLPNESSKGYSGEAIELFVERARARKPSFSLHRANRKVVASICRSLDGIPLAIELAAARVGSFTVDEILELVRDRFGLLEGGPESSRRHRTLRAAFEWSYDLLVEDERRALERLSVFAGGFVLEAAEELCSGDGIDELAVLDLLQRLVDKSLVMTESTQYGIRFRLLETIRVFAREKLFTSGTERQLLTAHHDWCARIAERALAAVNSPQRAELFAGLEAEHDNLRAALRWSIRQARDAGAACRLSGALARFWTSTGFLTEGVRWLVESLAIEGGGSQTQRAAALYGLAFIAHVQADHQRAYEAIDACLTLREVLGDRSGTAAALSLKGLIIGRMGRHEEAIAIQTECLAIARAMGQADDANQALLCLGLLEMYRGEFGRSRDYFEELLAAYRQSNNDHKVAVVLHNLGEVAWFRNEPAEAVSRFEECLALCAKLASRRLVADTKRSLGRSLGDFGDLDGAYTHLKEALEMQEAIGNREGVIEIVEASACINARSGSPALAISLRVAGANARRELSVPGDPGFEVVLDERVAEAAAALTDEEVADATERGRDLDLKGAVDLALGSATASHDSFE